MRYMIASLFFCVNLFGYNFVLLNSTDVEDDSIIEYINDQFTKHYSSEDEEKTIKFAELDSKDELIKAISGVDYADDEEEQQRLIDKYEDLEDDLNAVFKAEYFLIAKETKTREGRDELHIIFKYKGSTYSDETYIMPRLEEKESLYIKTLANTVLLQIGQKDNDFNKIVQY